MRVGGFDDWNATTFTSDNTAVAISRYRDYVSSGPHAESVPADIFSTPAYALTVPGGQQIASITLPSAASSGQLHIFSIAVN
jgi:hypothetical protein